MEILVTILLYGVAIMTIGRFVDPAIKDRVVDNTVFLGGLIVIGSTWSFSRRRKYPHRLPPWFLLICGWLAPLGLLSTLAFVLLFFFAERDPEGTRRQLMIYGSGVLLLLPAVFAEWRLRTDSRALPPSNSA
jgi:peptidoglycan/LPS O-acetylase OafA/YrhL